MTETQESYAVGTVAWNTDNSDGAAIQEKPKARRIRLRYRPEAMTLNDMCILESPPSHSKIRELLAKHFVDENGRWIDDIEAAQQAVGEVPKDGIVALINDLWRQINEHRKSVSDPN